MRTRGMVVGLLSLMLFASLLMSSVDGQTAGQKTANSAQAIKDFKAFYQRRLQHHGIVGSSFMLIHDDQVIAKEFYGLEHKEQNRAVDEDTIYHWASITKTFTGIAIMQLRDRGLLRLDDPVVKFVPELRLAHDPFGDI